MPTLDSLFTEFVREKTYLQNVTPKTREWYQTAWKAFSRYRAGVPSSADSIPLIGRADLQGFIVHLRGRGVKPISCNSWLRVLNTFCRWLHQNGHLPDPVRLAPQRVEKRLLPVPDDSAIRTLLRFRPNDFAHWRVHAVACTILDTGCRIEELLTTRMSDFDLDNLLLSVVGKGRKQRKVPFSTEPRKLLFRFGKVKERAEITSELMFPARDGGKWEHRNARRSYYCLLKNLGLRRAGFTSYATRLQPNTCEAAVMWCDSRSSSGTRRWEQR